jgi:hypothetical protein
MVEMSTEQEPTVQNQLHWFVVKLDCHGNLVVEWEVQRKERIHAFDAIVCDMAARDDIGP